MSNKLNFDLTRLSDRILAMLTRGAAEQPDGSPLDVVRDVLLREQVRRELQEDYEPVALDLLPGLTFEQVREVYRHLIADTAALESAAALAHAKGEEQERAELLVACEFVAAVSESLLSPGTGGIV